MSIDGDGCQCKHGHIHADRLHKWQKWAHEMRQIPSLKNRCLELKLSNAMHRKDRGRRTAQEAQPKIARKTTCYQMVLRINLHDRGAARPRRKFSVKCFNFIRNLMNWPARCVSCIDAVVSLSLCLSASSAGINELAAATAQRRCARNARAFLS